PSSARRAAAASAIASETTDAPAHNPVAHGVATTTPYSGLLWIIEFEHPGHLGGMPGGRSGAITRPGETTQAAYTLEKPGARQPACALADHQRTAQWALTACIQRSQMFERRHQRLHCRRRQLQALDERAVGQQMPLPARVVQFREQGFPMLSADTHVIPPRPEHPARVPGSGGWHRSARALPARSWPGRTG